MMTGTDLKDEVSDGTSNSEPYRARGLTVLAIVTGLAANLVVGLPRIDVSQRQLIDTDGYMRYSRILDLLEGHNGWFDNWIHWSNSPYGHSMHWTRLLDGHVITLAAPLAPFTGWRDAVYWTGLASGPLLHVGLIVVVIWTARRFVSAPAAALAGWVVALQPLIIGYSSIGRLDHHLLLTVLAMASLGCVLRALHGDRRAATAAGFLAGLGMWVSTETLLPVVLSALASVVWWIVFGDRLDVFWRWTTALAVTIVVSTLLEHGPADITTIEYDRISLPHLVAAVVGFAGSTVVMVLVRRRPDLVTGQRLRFMALIPTLVVPMFGVIVAYPGLRHGPFADTPQRIWDIWLSNVTESQPLWTGDSPVGAMVTQIGTPIVGLVCAVTLARRSAQRLVWIVIAAWLLVLIPLALDSARLALYPEALSALPVAAVAWEMILRFGTGSSLRRMLLRIGIIITAVAGHLIVGAIATAGSMSEEDELSKAKCDASALAPVIKRSVPEDAAILAHVDLGPILHVTTDRNVIATPHHRNVDGILAAYDIMRSTPDAARSAIEKRRIGAILVCRERDRNYLAPVPADSLAHALLDGSPPPWLEKVTGNDTDATLYLVTP